jgi:hypothetical protein
LVHSDRFCIDYRRLNAITKCDEHPLPRIDSILDSMGNAKLFSSLDLASGYHQVMMDDETKEKSAFTSPFGLFQFNVLSQGLTNAPPGFQRLMDFVLSGIQWQFSMVYLDDILVFSDGFNSHVKHLEEVFKRLRKFNLKLKLRKCFLGHESVEFLGHLVTSSGIRPHPDKAMVNFPTPTNQKMVRQLVGMLSYYRRFIDSFAKKAAPLHQLIKKEGKTHFRWSPECDAARLMFIVNC